MIDDLICRVIGSSNEEKFSFSTDWLLSLNDRFSAEVEICERLRNFIDAEAFSRLNRDGVTALEFDTTGIHRWNKNE